MRSKLLSLCCVIGLLSSCGDGTEESPDPLDAGRDVATADARRIEAAAPDARIDSGSAGAAGAAPTEAGGSDALRADATAGEGGRGGGAIDSSASDGSPDVTTTDAAAVVDARVDARIDAALEATLAEAGPLDSAVTDVVVIDAPPRPSCAVGNGGCDSHVTCTEADGSRVCGACPTGFSGTGSTQCVDVDECAMSNGGCDPLVTCANTVGSRTCSACPSGYSGTGATSCVDIDECAANTDGCDALVTCTNTPGSFACGNCPTGYTGGGASGCTDVDECLTGNGGCDALTTCQNAPGARTCTACPAGYTGTGATGCVDIDECAANPCQNGGACTNGVNSFTCACAVGYSGPTCLINIDDCAANPCENGGTCNDGVNSYTCTCATGYSGPTCLVNIDDCAANPCQNGGTCSDGVNSYTCACATGYSGPTCLVNIDDCAANPCQNGGTCSDGVNSYTCACAAGFSGVTCATNNALGNGNDGAVTVASGSVNLSTTNLATGRTCADGGDAVSYSVSALTATTAVLVAGPAAGCLAAGDDVLLINLQGTAAANANVGNYETLRIASVAGATVTFASTKTMSYGSGAGDDVGIGALATNQRVVLLRIPNFATVTISAGATLTANSWDGVKGGVLYLRSSGAATINGSLTMDGKGFRGGARPPAANQAGFQGESYGGLGAALQAALLGGGGAGLGEACASYGSAGGGAAYGAVGSNGTTVCTGRGAAVYGNAALTKLFLGSGGGSGGNDNTLGDNPMGGLGGAGGGILVLKAASLTVPAGGGVSSRGLIGQGNVGPCNGASTTDCWDYSGPGGGGSGGSLYLSGTTLALGTSLVTAVAGGGGVGPNSSGGAGGVGRIAVRYATSATGTTVPAADVAVGQ